MIEVPTVLRSNSFRHETWRRQPLHIQAHNIKGILSTLKQVNLENTAIKLAEVAPAQVLRVNDIIFAQRACLAEPKLRTLASDFGLQTVPTIRNVWVDLVIGGNSLTGIGNHFDTSDNFTIQIQGTKYWTLRCPTAEGIAIARKYLALRLPGTPILPTEPEVYEFEVHEGDMLYIPLFWMHSGTAASTSRSASIVLNGESWIDAIYFLCWQLADLGNWSFPLPRSLGSEGTDNPCLTAPPDIIESLVSALRSDDFGADRLISEWYKGRAERMIGHIK